MSRELPEPCPDCGERLGARYKHQGRLVCWPCTGVQLLTASRVRDPDWVLYRRKVWAAVKRDGACFYIDEDRVAGRCPICRQSLSVRFMGCRPAADFVCHGGRPEREVVAMLGKGRCDRR